MRSTSSLVFGDTELTPAYLKKVEEMQETGKVPSDWEGIVLEKKIKLWLPNDVRDQYKLRLMAESFIMIEYNTTVEDSMKLRFDIFDVAKKHSLIDGKEGCKMADNEFSLEMVDALITLYVTELIYPLYLCGSTRVRKLFKQNLTKYMTEQLA